LLDVPQLVRALLLTMVRFFSHFVLDRKGRCEYIRIMKRKAPAKAGLSRRETQIMDIVYAARECSAVDVRQAMPDPPSYSTVRKLLTILVDKGHLKHREEGGKYFYRPTKTPGTAGRSAIARVLETFYEGSMEKAVAAMLSTRDAELSTEELDGISELIEQAKKKVQ
jgi:BlaI family penicillinase repressor